MFASSCSILALSRLMALWLGRDIFAVVQDRLVLVRSGTVKQEYMINVAVDDSNIVLCPEGLCNLVSKHVISKIKVGEGVGLAEPGQLQVRIKTPGARAVPWCCVWLWAVIAALAVIIPNQLKLSRQGNF